MKKEDIILQLTNIHSKLDEFGVSRIGLFGSYSKNLQTESSDIDILIEFRSDRKTFDNFINISYLLEDLFKVKVELVTPESLSPGMRNKIVKDVIYAF